MIISSKIKILAVLLLVFAISTNIAWLNPFPDREVYKINEKIPMFWQYNSDSGVEILTAAYFPSVFQTYKTRIDRPGYPILVNQIGKFFGLIASPIYKLNPLQKTGIGYLILKFIIYCCSAFMMHTILSRYVTKEISLFAIFLTYIHSHSIFYATAFHTTEMQFKCNFYAISM